MVNCRTFLSCRCYYIDKLENQKTLGTRLRIRFSRGCLPFTTNSGEFRLGRKSMVNIFGVRPAGKFPRANGNSGRFPFSRNVRKFRLGRKWKTFRRFVPLGNSRKSGKPKKVLKPVFQHGNFVPRDQLGSGCPGKAGNRNPE